MAEAAKLEKFPSIVVPKNKGTYYEFACMFLLIKPSVLQLEFKVIPPEFPELKDLFAGLVGCTISLLTR